MLFLLFSPGSPAEKALNVFYYCTYEGAVDLDTIGKTKKYVFIKLGLAVSYVLNTGFFVYIDDVGVSL